MTDATLAPLPPTTATPATDEPVDDHVYRRRWWTLAVLCLSLVVIGVDNTILNVALPTLVTDLDATTSQLQWIVDGYTLVFAGLLLTAGSLGDRFGRRGALTIGLVIFGLGSVLSAIAGSAGQLIATRCVMGIGGALIMPATLSIVTNVFTVPAERARAIAIWAGFSAIGIAIGPLAGGYLLEHFYWGSVFLVNVPDRHRRPHRWPLLRARPRRTRSAPKLDPLGAVLSIAGLTALLWTIIEAPGKGWTSPATLVGFAVAVVVLGAFVAWELHSDHPMLNVVVLLEPPLHRRQPGRHAHLLRPVRLAVPADPVPAVVLGYSALAAGVRIIPFAVVMMALAPQSAKLAERFGTKIVVTVGLVTVATGLAVITQVEPSAGYTPVFFAFVDHGHRHGPHHGPGHRVDHGLAAPGQGRRRLGRQRHHPPGRRRPRRGHHRQRLLVGLRRLDASRHRRPGPAGRGRGHRSPTRSAAPWAWPSRSAARPARPWPMPPARAFVDGMHRGVLVGAAIALLGALVALLFLPARAPETADEGIDPTHPNVFDETDPTVTDHASPTPDAGADDVTVGPGDGEEVGPGAAALVPS